MSFLVMSRAEMQERGYNELDIILITGDAYVDHPSFGTAIIGKVLESSGFKVGVISQPDWHKDEDFLALGRPKLFFGITAGNMDSMVNHYTAQRKIRSDDAYTPGAVAGKRPDRASLIYTNTVKKLFKGVPVVLGGIEASLRRISHYDYWSDTVKNSLLADTKADILIYGMAERSTLAVAQALQEGKSINELKDLASTVVFTSADEDRSGGIVLPSAAASKDKQVYHELYRLFFDKFQDTILYQENGGRWIRHNPPGKALTETELDRVYALDYENAPHPIYKGARIPAWEQIRDSITTHRGCYGGCSFCAIGLHQGRAIQSRSKTSILQEVGKLSAHKKEKSGGYVFHGSISDLGGPTANMYGSYCKLGFPDTCKRQSCLFPKICPNLVADHKLQLKLLAEVEKLPGVKHIFISSGIRFDLASKSPEYIRALAAKYTGGRLKLAPEHVSKPVLDLMGKPGIDSYEDFSRLFMKQAAELGLKRQIIPYIIIGHPGTTKAHALELASWLRKHGLMIEQVQEFTPTPMTISTTMYYTGLDFYTVKPIYVPKGREIREQKELAMWWKNEPRKAQAIKPPPKRRSSR